MAAASCGRCRISRPAQWSSEIQCSIDRGFLRKRRACIYYENVPDGRFIPTEIATKLALALGIGLLVGFEREWSHKDVGVRSFAIVSLLGMLCTLESQTFAWFGMAAVIALTTMMNVGNILLHRQIETTTSVALIVTFTLGVLVGQGHVFTPVAAAVLMTLLLALKPELTRFAGGVTAEELRSAVLLGLIGFVIYPILPNRTIDPWGLLNPQEAWLTVILIAGLSFVNYLLLRAFSTRGLYYSAMFGGLVNSTATIAELSGLLGGKGAAAEAMLVVLSLITVLAMFVRNLAVLTAFSPGAGWLALWPIVGMGLVTAAVAVRMKSSDAPPPPPQLSSPIAIGKIASLGLLFVVIQALATLGQRVFGEAGSVVVSFLGGFISSASATAASGSLAAHGQISLIVAAEAAVFASIASSIINIPILYRRMGPNGAFKRLVLLQASATVIGLAVLFGVIMYGKR